MESERVEEYLEAIYKRQMTENPVSTSSLAKDLKVSLPAVTDMLRRLESEGWVEYRANKGTTLTAQGNEKALSVVRRHRLWERFLTDILGLKWDRVHSEACRLEHATSPETERRLASLLGDASTCPHGQPIPDQRGNIKNQEFMPLAQFEPGQSICISAVAEEYPGLLREIEKMGLKPNTMATVKEKNNDGAVVLKLKRHKLLVKKEIAAILLAKPICLEKDVKVEETAISNLGTGEIAIVKSYTGGRSMLGHCLSMGFTPGSVVKMVQNFGRGPVLVKIRDTEVALGRGIADKLMVTRNETTAAC